MIQKSGKSTLGYINLATRVNNPVNQGLGRLKEIQTVILWNVVDKSNSSYSLSYHLLLSGYPTISQKSAKYVSRSGSL